VKVCDVWKAMMALAGWSESDDESPLPGSEDAEENQILRSFLSDGRLLPICRDSVFTADI